MSIIMWICSRPTFAYVFTSQLNNKKRIPPKNTNGKFFLHARYCGSDRSYILSEISVYNFTIIRSPNHPLVYLVAGPSSNFRLQISSVLCYQCFFEWLCNLRKDSLWMQVECRFHILKTPNDSWIQLLVYEYLLYLRFGLEQNCSFPLNK
jgi:hypothetical protein